MQLHITDEEHAAPLGGIYVGKVQHMVKNLDAAFVEYEKGKTCFLSRQDCQHPILTGRVYDGRLVQGDELLVQIQKEPMKEKEAGGTTNLSFPGKYIVLTTGKQKIGYSHKHSPSQKKRLKDLVEGIELFREVQSRYGIVFRTNAGELDNSELLEAELAALSREADEVLRTGIHKSCFSVIKKPQPPFLKDLQDIYSDTYDKIITDDEVLHQEIKAYLEQNQLADLPKLRYYDSKKEGLDLSKVYPIVRSLEETISSKVWLKSGGWIVIEPTEALVSIDVNSGKAIHRRDPEEHFLRINIEAAEEMVHQVRLRSLSGILLIDFISMDSKENRKKLMDHLGRLAARESVKTDVVDMTPLGLVEVTRRKIRKPLHEQKENIQKLLDGYRNR